MKNKFFSYIVIGIITTLALVPPKAMALESGGLGTECVQPPETQPAQGDSAACTLARQACGLAAALACQVCEEDPRSCLTYVSLEIAACTYAALTCQSSRTPFPRTPNYPNLSR